MKKMAVKLLENNDTLKMNIVMKDGREFLGCDVAAATTDALVAFWNDNAVRMVPVQDVLHIDFYNE